MLNISVVVYSMFAQFAINKMQARRAKQ